MTLVLIVASMTLARAADIEVYFSPNGGVTDAVVREINAAKSKILIQAYSFTSIPIATALVAAEKRGVDVEAILDKSNIKHGYSSITFLENAGIPVFIDDRVRIAHSKIMIVDDSEIITGSFNFTRAAESQNAENLLIIKKEPTLVSKYIVNYKWRLSMSQRSSITEQGISNK